MVKKEVYRGYFRKGWVLHTIIQIGIVLSGMMFIWLAILEKGAMGVIIGVSGVMSVGLGGGLMDVILCHEYHKTGEQKL